MHNTCYYEKNYVFFNKNSINLTVRYYCLRLHSIRYMHWLIIDFWLSNGHRQLN